MATPPDKSSKGKFALHVVSLPLSTAGGNLHAQLGCQAAEIRWYLAVLSSFTPHCPLSTARDPVSQHSKGGRHCPLSTARDCVSKHSKGDMQKKREKDRSKSLLTTCQVPVTGAQAGEQSLSLRDGFGPGVPCYNSGWRHSYLVSKSSLCEMRFGPVTGEQVLSP